MITPASIGDWVQAVAMASLLAGAGLALSRALRYDVGLATQPRPRVKWEPWRDQPTGGPLPFDMAVGAGRPRERP